MEKKVCLSPLKSYNNLKPMLYMWPFCCSFHVWSALVSPQQLELPPSRPSIQFETRIHQMLENTTKTTKTINIRFNSKIQHCQIQEENPTAKCFLTVLLAQLPKSACKKHSMLTRSVEPNTLFQILNQHYFCWRLQHGGHTKHSFLFQSNLYQCDAAVLAHMENAHTGHKSLPGVTNTSSRDPDLQGGTTLHWSPEGSR